MEVLINTGKCFARYELTITTEQKPNLTDRHFEIRDYKYIRKAGNTLEDALKKFPELTLDKTFSSSRRSIQKVKTHFNTEETFRFGKYNGQTIQSCHNPQYIIWYMNLDNNYITKEHKKYCEWCLIEYFDYIKEVHGDHVFFKSPEIQKKDNWKEFKTKKAIKAAEQHKPVFLEIKRWPNSNGEVVVDDVTYVFLSVRANYYGGIVYYMPVVNNVCKRIKNKLISANLLYLRDKIYIESFNIVKDA